MIAFGNKQQKHVFKRDFKNFCTAILIKCSSTHSQKRTAKTIRQASKRIFYQLEYCSQYFATKNLVITKKLRNFYVLQNCRFLILSEKKQNKHLTQQYQMHSEHLYKSRHVQNFTSKRAQDISKVWKR